MEPLSESEHDMSGPEDNPADDVQPTKEEYEAWEKENASVRVRSYHIAICDDCLNLVGEQCHNPECVFIRQTMAEVSEHLNMLMIRPIVNGEQLPAPHADCDDFIEEYQVMAERLIETQEIYRSSESGQLCWKGSGERLI